MDDAHLQLLNQLSLCPNCAVSSRPVDRYSKRNSQNVLTIKSFVFHSISAAYKCHRVFADLSVAIGHSEKEWVNFGEIFDRGTY